MYAAGKIPGGFFKREGRATERATLTARMIDRPIRPLWPKGFKHEVQVICTVLSADMVVPHDILAINGASAALAVSPLPFLGPVGAVRVAPHRGRADRQPDVPAARRVGARPHRRRHARRPTMIEAGGDQVPEETMLDAFALAHSEIIRICDAIDELAREAGKEKWIDVELNAELESRQGETVARRIAEAGCATPVRSSTSCWQPRRRPSRWNRARRTSSATPGRSGLTMLPSRNGSPRSSARARPVRERAARPHRRRAGLQGLKSRKRRHPSRPHPGRGAAAVPGRRGRRARQGLDDPQLRQEGRGRDLQGPRPEEDRGRQAAARRPRHGGDPADRDGVGISRAPRPRCSRAARRRSSRSARSARRRAAANRRPVDRAGAPLHHYNFPPYSVGETGFMRGPKRRDIGHGALAQRARGGHPVHRGLPVHDPPGLGDARVQRLIVDGLGVRLDDVAQHAGVPIAAPVSGIAMGLVKEGDDYAILLDIQGCGGPSGRHGLQGRRHRRGSPRCRWTSRSAASPRRSCAPRSGGKARAVFILDRMAETISEPQAGLAGHAANLVDPDQPRNVGMVIGKGGGRSARSRPTTRSRSTSRRTGRSSSTRPRARTATPRSRRSRR